MPYNFNPNFNKHFNTEKDKYKFIKRTGDETPYSNPDVRAMNNNYNNYKSPKLVNFLNNDEFDEDIKMYKLEDIDHPNGWDFKEIDMLGEMNFRIDDDYKMYSEIEVPSIKMQNEKIKTFVYKTDEGYVLEANRRYVFETFNKMLEFIDSIPMTWVKN
jgi:hypothetical protein